MKGISRVIGTMVLLLLTVCMAVPAHAVGLLAKSTGVNAVGGFPVWLQDQNSLALQACVDPARCPLPVAGEEPNFNPANPLSFPGPPLNFPSEHFFFYAESNFPVNGDTTLVIMAIEAAFAPSVAPGNQTMFHRFRVRIANPPVSGEYTLRHPWGTTTFTGQPCTAGVRCTVTADTNTGLPPDFAGILGVSPDGSISHFLVQPAPPAGFIGDGVSATTVTGSPTAFNRVELVAPGGAIVGSSDQFIVAGKKIGMEVSPFPTAQMKAVVGTPALTTVTVTNLSGAALDFTAATAIAIDPASPNAADFSVAAPLAGTPTCLGASIPAVAPNNICAFSVDFHPAASAIPQRTATLKITPAIANTNAPVTSVALAGTAQFPVTVTVGPNGALQKVLPGGNVAAVSEPADAGSTLKFLPLPNVVVPNVSKFMTLFEVNDVAVRPAADGTFEVAVDDAPKAVEVTFVRPGDVSVDPASGLGDGQVTIPDALEALRIVTGLNSAPTGAQRTAADVGPLVSGKPTADGLVDISDVLTILWRVVSPTAPNW
jgi:hypothetical protein